MALLTACLQVAWIIQLRVFRQNRHFLAFCSPSRSFLRGGVWHSLPLRAVLKPSATKHLRIFSTVCLVQQNALAILLSVQFKPSASAFNKICARGIFPDYLFENTSFLYQEPHNVLFIHDPTAHTCINGRDYNQKFLRACKLKV